MRKPRSTRRLTGKMIARLSRLATDTNTVPCVGSPLIAPSCALANARPKSVSMPMTSPVERISGPSRLSTTSPSLVRNRLNGQHRLLDRHRRVHRHPAAVGVRGQHALGPQLGDGRAHHDPGGRVGERHAGGLGDERHGARRTRVGLEHVEDVLGEGELHVHQARAPRCPRRA